MINQCIGDARSSKKVALAMVVAVTPALFIVLIQTDGK